MLYFLLYLQQIYYKPHHCDKRGNVGSNLINTLLKLEDQKRINYFYIDESGNINNDSKIFILGCIKTDSPTTISDALVKLKSELASEIYYQKFKKQILEKGFHATENTMDMRAELYKLLPLMNYRAYFVITKKDSDYFKDSMKTKDESEFYEYNLKKLLEDRISSHKNDKNIFYFETILLQKKSLKKVLDDFFATYGEEYDNEYSIVGKDEENLAIIDYLNFIFNYLLTNAKPIERMELNLELVSPKMAIVHLLHKNIFLSRQKAEEFTINLKNITTNY